MSETEAIESADAPTASGFRLTVVDGDVTYEATGPRCAIGTHQSNDLCLSDPKVSRFHCEIVLDGPNARIRDLGSRNGTVVDGVRVADAFLRAGSVVRLAGVSLRFDLLEQVRRVPISSRRSFHGVVAESIAMRAALAPIERAAGNDMTVLLEGETGTGKGKVAEAIHRASARSGRPFVVVDCGAIPANLLESELYGHEKGAFTGAGERRVGAFEEASGGTIFLDEIGELPLEQQPKLLRALESREIRRVGSNAHQKVDVRIVAATNRDLRREVNDGRYRADLYFRLAVMRVALPPLRERADDLPALSRDLLRSLGASDDAIAALCTPELFASLRRGAWPGNVRELRNHLERCLAFEEALPIGEEAAPRAEVDASVPYAEARRRTLDRFEQAYVKDLVARHRGQMTKAAAAAGIDRVYLYKLLKRHR
ncbi:MAG: sigma 54-interacting transcriptional regulator [Labilithrix sp.]|nr:sigma 54-interacting transcriptional regulator [Labilithrix sp.]MCW5812870.1 sigma 54-interacting transcriptional regulator [Labilithrix sp.]